MNRIMLALINFMKENSELLLIRVDVIEDENFGHITCKLDSTPCTFNWSKVKECWE